MQQLIGSRTFGHVTDVASLNREFDVAAQALLSLMDDRHLNADGARHFCAADRPVSEHRFATSPFTGDVEVWERTQRDQSQPDFDPNSYVPFLVQASPSGGQQLRWDVAPAVAVSTERILLAGLTRRLNPLVLSWAHNPELGRPDWHSSRLERSRLLAHLDPAWGQPMGRFHRIEPGPFDHIESWGELLTSWESLAQRLGQLTGQHDLAATSRYTSNRGQYEAPSHRAINLVGTFDEHTWTFPIEFRSDRGGTSGASMSAETLLWRLTLDATRDPGRSMDERIRLLDQLVPGWNTSAPSGGRSLPII